MWPSFDQFILDNRQVVAILRLRASRGDPNRSNRRLPNEEKKGEAKEKEKEHVVKKRPKRSEARAKVSRMGCFAASLSPCGARIEMLA